MYALTIKNFCEYAEKTNQNFLICEVDNIISENSFLNEFSDVICELPFLIYQYKYLNPFELKSAALNKRLKCLHSIKKLLHPHSKLIVFKVSTNKDFYFENYQDLVKALENIDSSNILLSFEDSKPFEIGEIKKGTISFLIILKSILLSFYATKALKMLARVAISPKDTWQKFSISDKGVRNFIIYLLKMSLVLSPLGLLEVESISLTIDLIKELLDFFDNDKDGLL